MGEKVLLTMVPGEYMAPLSLMVKSFEDRKRKRRDGRRTAVGSGWDLGFQGYTLCECLKYRVGV